MTTAAPATSAAATSEGAPAAPPAGKPAEPPTKPVEPPAGKPTEKPAEKPADPPPPAQDAKPDEKPAASTARTVPDKYDLKIPDGATAWLDEGDLAPIAEIARGLQLDNAGAQALIEQHIDTLAAMSEAFKTATEADQEYGGEHLEETRQLAKLALDTLRPAGTPRGDALRKILARSGYGNQLEIVSLLADLGRGMREDRPVGGGQPARAAKDAASVLYGSTPAK
jgi:hypothetical protein